MEQLYFEDLKVGDRYVSSSKTMSPTHSIMFGGITGDRHPIHNDLEYCRARGLPERVVHGTLNVAQVTIGACALADQLHDSVIFFVEQSARFINPVFLGDTVTATHEIAELIPKRDKGILKIRSTLHNQRDEVVLEGEQVYMIKKRHADAP